MSDLIPAAIGCALTVVLIAACSWFGSRTASARQAAQEPPGAPGPHPGPERPPEPKQSPQEGQPMTDRPRTARLLLTGYGLSDRFITRVLDEHAHELAEQIRQDTTVMGEAGDQYALLYADVIDPEAQR